jgi:hypothetical protein
MTGKLFNLHGRFRLKILFFLILISLSNIFAAQTPAIKDVYFNLYSGHLHQGPNPQSTSLKVLSCGDILKVIPNEKEETPHSKFNWNKLQTASYVGYVRQEFLSAEPPNCFNNKYLKFVEQFKLELTDKYNWGRLYDQYVLGKSKVK